MSESRTRLLVFHPALAPYRIDLFNALSECYQLKIVFLSGNVSYQAYDQKRLLGELHATYGFLGHGLRVGRREVRFGVSAEVDSFRPDVVVTSEFSSTTMAVVLRRMLGGRIPHVIWTADNPFVIASENPFRTLARRLILPHVDGLIVYSSDVASYYVRNLGFKRAVGVSPNAQSEVQILSKLGDANSRAQELARQHSLLRRKVVLYVG